jgi:hypothetical protein
VKIEPWHRRQALCIASQMPGGPDDALAVLDCVRELVETFLRSEEPAPVPKTLSSKIKVARRLTLAGFALLNAKS